MIDKDSQILNQYRMRRELDHKLADVLNEYVGQLDPMDLIAAIEAVKCKYAGFWSCKTYEKAKGMEGGHE
jgi:Txe/YoeB family toxin of Txe-Axe toxin-antitoxin module